MKLKTGWKKFCEYCEQDRGSANEHRNCAEAYRNGWQNALASEFEKSLRGVSDVQRK